MENSKILILNGASSAGKTALCKELQAVLAEPYIHLKEDSFVYGTYHGKFLQPGIVEETFAKTMLGYYRTLIAFASAGHNVLADTGFYDKTLLDQCVRELAGQNVWLIGVRCSLPELERREKERGDRRIGQAREQFDTIHAHVIYDIEVDTSSGDLTACARIIENALFGGNAPTAMARLREAFGNIL